VVFPCQSLSGQAGQIGSFKFIKYARQSLRIRLTSLAFLLTITCRAKAFGTLDQCSLIKLRKPAILTFILAAGQKPQDGDNNARKIRRHAYSTFVRYRISNVARAIYFTDLSFAAMFLVLQNARGAGRHAGLLPFSPPRLSGDQSHRFLHSRLLHEA